MSSKISALTAASAYDGTEVFPVVQSSSTKKGLISALATYLAGISAWLPFSKLTGVITPSQMGAAAAGYATLMSFQVDVNFNSANTDNAIALALPTGFTRYLVSTLRIYGASGTLTTSTFGVFTAASGGGTAIVASGTANTVASGSDGASNSAMNCSIPTSSTVQWAIASVPTLYFRVQTAQGSAATGKVSVSILALP